MPLKAVTMQLKKCLTADEQMRREGNARKTKAPTGARPWLDWINSSARFFYMRSSADICG